MGMERKGPGNVLLLLLLLRICSSSSSHCFTNLRVRLGACQRILGRRSLKLTALSAPCPLLPQSSCLRTPRCRYSRALDTAAPSARCVRLRFGEEFRCLMSVATDPVPAARFYARCNAHYSTVVSESSPRASRDKWWVMTGTSSNTSIRRTALTWRRIRCMLLPSLPSPPRPHLAPMCVSPRSTPGVLPGELLEVHAQRWRGRPERLPQHLPGARP